ncbi:hypothetical protein BH23VER1_BH23VER1_13340 [soil metagenome]
MSLVPNIAIGGALALALFLAPVSPAASTVADGGSPASPTPIPVAESIAIRLPVMMDELVDVSSVDVALDVVESAYDRVPEPGTVILIIAAGVFALASRFRRRQSH